MRGLKYYIISIFITCSLHLTAQTAYTDSLKLYVDNYIKDHEVVKGDDKQYFRFFPVDKQYRVIASFQRTSESRWLSFQTSGNEKKMFRVYGAVSFKIHDTLVRLNLYQAQNLLADPKYSGYLALMFTDKTTGIETYDAGRYLDLDIADIKNNLITIDFNKAYNPYCAYVKNRYNCPIPPRENDMPVAIRAGEKEYAKREN
jgi:hypothetical protein